MKIGYRKPSIKKSISARTTAKWKRAAKRKINPYYGKKGMGVFTNPNKAAYNKFYNKFTIGLQPTTRKTRTKRRTKSNSVTGIFSIICLLALISLFIPPSDNTNDNTTTVTTTTETKTFTKEDFLINDTLINYCKIAEYPLDENELLRIQNLENPFTQYSNVINSSVQLHISGQSKSQHDLVIQLSIDDTSNKMLYSIFRDFLLSLNSNITIDEIETLWDNLGSLEYRYTDYNFYNLNIRYDESDRINNIHYSISIVYN